MLTSNGLIVPASEFRYGSILIDVTRNPDALRRTPIEEIEIPFPKPETTPPDTTMYFISSVSLIVLARQTAESQEEAPCISICEGVARMPGSHVKWK